MNLNKFSTIIIVNKDQNQTQSIRIKTKHLKRIKHYLGSTICIVLILIGAIIYLNLKNRRNEKEKQQLLTQVAQLKVKIPIAVANANSASSYIQSIQSKLQKINDYLKRRGLTGFSTNSIGGNGNAEESKLNDTEKYSMYDEYLGNLLNSVAFTPMGYPRVSSITSMFGYRGDPFDSENAEYHPGIDFKGAQGDIVHVTADGKVFFTGWRGGYGNCIIIQHKNDFQTLYGHLSHIDVQEGQSVHTGDVIGKVGSTGRSTGAHLHYEVRKNGKPIDPIKFLTLNN